VKDPLKSVGSSLIGDKVITIHVVDTHTNATEDFLCNKNLILKEMKYFEKFTLATADGK